MREGLRELQGDTTDIVQGEERGEGVEWLLCGVVVAFQVAVEVTAWEKVENKARVRVVGETIQHTHEGRVVRVSELEVLQEVRFLPSVLPVKGGGTLADLDRHWFHRGARVQGLQNDSEAALA